MVKRVLSKSVTCRRLEGKPCSVRRMADLPGFRVREAAPFPIDFAGPLFIKYCARANKVSMELFTCRGLGGWPGV